ncbi:DUF397 domain-containing protein [Streptomyces roseoverticillatus]|uniref:DUF397 domain-containing protein n=1 Tax=Streptomyces roseoverticillatus TaxID=66429 RepID=UPI0035ABB06F|nr:DUF397 domain-containing protein [Streptomyces roseoverticillatus]
MTEAAWRESTRCGNGPDCVEARRVSADLRQQDRPGGKHAVKGPATARALHL